MSTALSPCSEFNGYRPVVHPSAFVHPQAGGYRQRSSVPTCTSVPGGLRGDWGEIVVTRAGCNAGELHHPHVPRVKVVHPRAHMATGPSSTGPPSGRTASRHERRAHGQRYCSAKVHRERSVSLLIPFGKPKAIVGNPARVVKDVSDEMLAWKTEGTKLYQQLPFELAQRHPEAVQPCARWTRAGRP